MASQDVCCLPIQGGGTDTDGDSDGSCDSTEFRRGGGVGGGRRGRGGGDDAADLMAQTLEVRIVITLFRIVTTGYNKQHESGSLQIILLGLPVGRKRMKPREVTTSILVFPKRLVGKYSAMHVNLPSTKSGTPTRERSS